MWSQASVEVPPAASRTSTVRACGSIATTSERSRTSSPLRRCASGVRATRSGQSGTSPATQYGMPHME
jgi:hypothetical protein